MTSFTETLQSVSREAALCEMADRMKLPNHTVSFFALRVG